MGTGYLKIITRAAGGTLPVSAAVTITDGDTILHNFLTNRSGIAEPVALEAPLKELSLDPESMEAPYSVYNVMAEAKGFKTVNIYGVMIFDTITSILHINMVPSENGETMELHLPAHQLHDPSEQATKRLEPPEILQDISIPEYITVHLGLPESNARDVPIPLAHYIKVAASYELFPTWHPAAIEANVYSITSLALNRIFSGLYRGMGYDFDITNAMKYDPAFVVGGQIFSIIDEMVDRIFNRYICRKGLHTPFLAESCDGRLQTCPGLWKWGSLALAARGFNALEILRHYYPADVEIVETDILEGANNPFPGYPVREGMSGRYVQVLQSMLNHICVSFPEIPVIMPEDGTFGPITAEAVRVFQRIHEPGLMEPSGVVDINTWYRISLIASCLSSTQPHLDNPVRESKKPTPQNHKDSTITLPLLILGMLAHKKGRPYL